MKKNNREHRDYSENVNSHISIQNLFIHEAIILLFLRHHFKYGDTVWIPASAGMTSEN